MIVTIGAIVLAFLGAVSMAVSGMCWANGESGRFEALCGLFLIALALVMTAAS